LQAVAEARRAHGIANMSVLEDSHSRTFSLEVIAHLQAAAEGDAQTAASAASAAGCSPWFMAHAPLLLAASPRGAAAMAAPLQHAGGDQVPHPVVLSTMERKFHHHPPPELKSVRL
jgi:hypothetical protein